MNVAERSIAVLIPTYNMGTFLEPLLRSFEASGLDIAVQEILFIDDGSTDDTAEILEKLREQNPKVKVVHLQKNSGRFEARKRGAESSSAEQILFLDSRVILPSDFGKNLKTLSAVHENVVGHVDIDTDRSLFCLYWDRSHRAIFRNSYRNPHTPVTLTPENYDRYLKGTTVFLCSRKMFLEACATFGNQAVLNDDTYLMYEMVKKTPLTIHPQLRIQWVPRETATEFLKRLWERGPSFVEYHVFQQRGVFFWISLVGTTFTLGWLTLVFTQPRAAIAILIGAFLAAILSTAAFAQNPREFFRMAPLHVAVIVTFGLGILRGISLNTSRALRNRRSRKAGP